MSGILDTSSSTSFIIEIAPSANTVPLKMGNSKSTKKSSKPRKSSSSSTSKKSKTPTTTVPIPSNYVPELGCYVTIIDPPKTESKKSSSIQRSKSSKKKSNKENVDTLSVPKDKKPSRRSSVSSMSTPVRTPKRAKNLHSYSATTSPQSSPLNTYYSRSEDEISIPSVFSSASSASASLFQPVSSSSSSLPISSLEYADEPPSLTTSPINSILSPASSPPIDPLTPSYNTDYHPMSTLSTATPISPTGDISMLSTLSDQQWNTLVQDSMINLSMSDMGWYDKSDYNEKQLSQEELQILDVLA